MATKYNNVRRSKTEMLEKKSRGKAGKLQTHECVFYLAIHVCVSLSIAHTNTQRYSDGPSEAIWAKPNALAKNTRCESASEAKTNDANTFSVPLPRQRTRPKAKKKNIREFFLAHRQFLPAASCQFASCQFTSLAVWELFAVAVGS